MKKIILCLVVIAVCLSMVGCVRSRVQISSVPSGADVTFHRQPRGKTPVEIPFIWYWHYEIKIEKDGYVPIETTERFRAPPWLWFPIDLVTELLPFPVYDTKRLNYVLVPEEKF